MAVDDIYQINVCQIVNGRECSNVFYYAETALSSFPVHATAGKLNEQFFFSIWDETWSFKITSQVTLTCIWTRRMWPTESLPNTDFYEDEIGKIIFDSIPNGSCALISMTAADPARNFKRRTYLSGISEAWVVNSQIPADKVTSLNVLANLFANEVLSIEGGGLGKFKPAAFSKKLAAASDPAPFRMINGFKTQKNVRSQRRRNLPGSG